MYTISNGLSLGCYIINDVVFFEFISRVSCVEWEGSDIISVILFG